MAVQPSFDDNESKHATQLKNIQRACAVLQKVPKVM
jgi:hypothetical protein